MKKLIKLKEKKLLRRYVSFVKLLHLIGKKIIQRTVTFVHIFHLFNLNLWAIEISNILRYISYLLDYNYFFGIEIGLLSLNRQRDCLHATGVATRIFNCLTEKCPLSEWRFCGIFHWWNTFFIMKCEIDAKNRKGNTLISYMKFLIYYELYRRWKTIFFFFVFFICSTVKHYYTISIRRSSFTLAIFLVHRA